MGKIEELISLVELADRLGLARRTVYDRKWRERVGSDRSCG